VKPRQVFKVSDVTKFVHQPQTFCSKCGTPFESDVPSNARVCGSCGSEEYKNPLPGAVTVVHRDGQVLIGKRGKNSFEPGKWCLPGGFIEFGEDFLFAARREVLEETGLTVEIEGIVNVVSNFLAPDLQTLVIVLQARIVGGNPAPGDDLQELKWVSSVEDLPDMAFASDRHIVGRFFDGSLCTMAVDTEYAG
jgi:8-oxo-dGTP diphosphatase